MKTPPPQEIRSSWLDLGATHTTSLLSTAFFICRGLYYSCVYVRPRNTEPTQVSSCSCPFVQWMPRVAVATDSFERSVVRTDYSGKRTAGPPGPGGKFLKSGAENPGEVTLYVHSARGTKRLFPNPQPRAYFPPSTPLHPLTGM